MKAARLHQRSYKTEMMLQPQRRKVRWLADASSSDKVGKWDWMLLVAMGRSDQEE